jgi:hypothetical protein
LLVDSRRFGSALIDSLIPWSQVFGRLVRRLGLRPLAIICCFSAGLLDVLNRNRRFSNSGFLYPRLSNRFLLCWLIGGLPFLQLSRALTRAFSVVVVLGDLPNNRGLLVIDRLHFTNRLGLHPILCHLSSFLPTRLPITTSSRYSSSRDSSRSSSMI